MISFKIRLNTILHLLHFLKLTQFGLDLDFICKSSVCKMRLFVYQFVMIGNDKKKLIKKEKRKEIEEIFAY